MFKYLQSIFFFHAIYSILASQASSSNSQYSNMSLHWNTYNLSSARSSVCAIKDSNENVYICGGKSWLKTCDKLTFNALGIETAEQINSEIKISYMGIWYFNIRSLFCEIQNEGAFYDDENFCILGSTIGNESPRCLCCNINTNGVDMFCTDLELSDQCSSLHDSCVVHNTITDQLIQVGGYVSNVVSDDILVHCYIFIQNIHVFLCLNKEKRSSAVFFCCFFVHLHIKVF